MNHRHYSAMPAGTFTSASPMTTNQAHNTIIYVCGWEVRLQKPQPHWVYLDLGFSPDGWSKKRVKEALFTSKYRNINSIEDIHDIQLLNDENLPYDIKDQDMIPNNAWCLVSLIPGK